MEPLLRGYELLLNFELFIEKELQQNDIYSSIFCGAIAGICAKTVIAPAERIKMSFQVSSERFTLEKALTRTRNTIQSEGILSLWKGHSTTIIRTAPYAGLSYAVHDYAENGFKKFLKVDNLPFIYKFLCGSIAGVGGTLMTYPLDVLRIRLALGGTWKSSIRQGGFSQGITPTLLGIIPYSGTCWGAKQTILEIFPNFAHRQPNVFESLIINAIAGLCGQFATYPLDIVRRRMQIAVPRASDGKIPGFREVLAHLISSEGPRGLSKGFSLNIVKGPVALSISLTVYDLLRKRLHDYPHTKSGGSMNSGSDSGKQGNSLPMVKKGRRDDST